LSPRTGLKSLSSPRTSVDLNFNFQSAFLFRLPVHGSLSTYHLFASPARPSVSFSDFLTSQPSASPRRTNFVGRGALLYTCQETDGRGAMLHFFFETVTRPKHHHAHRIDCTIRATCAHDASASHAHHFHLIPLQAKFELGVLTGRQVLLRRAPQLHFRQTRRTIVGEQL